MKVGFKTFEIEGEKAYPSFTVTVKVQTDRTLPLTWERSLVEGRPDRQWTTAMKRSPLFYPELPSPDKVLVDAQVFWNVNKDTKYDETSHPELRGQFKYPNYSDVEIIVGDVQWSTWILEWFCHVTFREGRTDQELLLSFQRHVDRAYRAVNYDREVAGNKLMGAEDRWRWKGHNDNPPPCTCDHCANAGLARIAH